MLDPLTGLYNRQFLEQHLATELARSRRHGYPMNVLMVDLNNFKQINDHYGQSTGDAVLKEFADRLKKSIRSSDLAVRMGADEFLVLLTESSLERVPHMIARLDGLEVDFDGEKIPVTFVAGWTAYHPNERPEQLLERVEQELLADKRTGRTKGAIQQAQTDMSQMQNIEALERLAGKVAHDFNHLLGLIKGYSELALDHIGLSDPLREYIEQIQQANERANSLARQLLAFRRHVQVPTVLDLNTLAAGMEPMLRRLIGEQIELVIKPGEGLGRVIRRPGADRASHSEPDAQRSRQHAQWRQTHARDSKRRTGRGLCPSAPRRPARLVRHACSTRQRSRYGPGDTGPHLRAFLHYQGGERDRA